MPRGVRTTTPYDVASSGERRLPGRTRSKHWSWLAPAPAPAPPPVPPTSTRPPSPSSSPPTPSSEETLCLARFHGRNQPKRGDGGDGGGTAATGAAADGLDLFAPIVSDVSDAAAVRKRMRVSPTPRHARTRLELAEGEGCY